MTDQADVHELPENLPIPEDDGAADHLTGMRLPSTPLASTAGNLVDLTALEDRTVVYCYPMTGPPEKNLPQGWDEIPGARGCTPQSCTFRDHFAELQALHTRVFGLSTKALSISKRLLNGYICPSSYWATEIYDWPMSRGCLPLRWRAWSC